MDTDARQFFPCDDGIEYISRRETTVIYSEDKGNFYTHGFAMKINRHTGNDVSFALYWKRAEEATFEKCLYFNSFPKGDFPALLANGTLKLEGEQEKKIDIFENNSIVFFESLYSRKTSHNKVLLYQNCCVECFNSKKYPEIEDFIKERASENGDCDFCGLENISIIKPEMLSDLFKDILNLYSILTEGEHYPPGVSPDFSDDLTLALNSDWKVFPDFLDNDASNIMLDKIRKCTLKNHSAFQYWGRDEDRFFQVTEETVWQEFSKYITHERRYIINKNRLVIDGIGLPSPKEAFEKIVIELSNETFYRARIGYEKEQWGRNIPINPSNMGMPPHDKCTQPGRATPVGISYLYIANSVETAIFEVRPSINDLISVATVKIIGFDPDDRNLTCRPLRIVDLTEANMIELNPFSPSFPQEYKSKKMLEALNKAMSLPINPKEAAFKYIPTQFLTELILDLGYDGIKFMSSVNATGFNLVLFRDDCVYIEKSSLFSTTDIKYSHKDCDSEIKNPVPFISRPFKQDFESSF